MTKPRQELVSQSAQPMQAQPYQEAQSFSFEQMQRMASSVAKAGLFGVKDADQALSLMMIAQAEGKHPAIVARDYYVFSGGGKNVVGKYAEAMMRDFQNSGGQIEWHELTDKAAIATFSHPHVKQSVRIDWDTDRAKRAGLGGKDMYGKFARSMLRSRCVAEGIRTVWPHSTGGFHTPEELSFVHDELIPASSIATAIEQTVDALTPDHIDALINSMDVGTLQALESAFSAAWRSTKDPVLRQRFKSVYDGQRAEIAASAVATVGDAGDGT
jgi:hypothetical protein